MKKLIGVDVGSYTFNAATKTIVISNVELKNESVLLVVHVPSNTILYNFSSPAKGGTFTLPGTLVLDVDTSGYFNADPLQVYVDVDVPQDVSLVSDEFSESLLVDVGDVYLRALLRKLMQLKYNGSSDLSVTVASGSVTVSTITTVTTANMGVGDAGKAVSYQQFSAITGNMSRRCFQWE